MKIGIVLSNTPGYSETFFTSKIKGLQANDNEVVFFVQKMKPDFNLCPVIVAPKVYGNSLTQTFAMLVVFFKLIPNIKTIYKFLKLERASGTGISTSLKKIYLNAHILSEKLDWLHFGFATQAIGSELVAKAIGAKMAVSFRGFDINVFPLKNPGCYNKVWKNVDKIHSISNYLVKVAYSLGLHKNVSVKIITPAVSESICKVEESSKNNSDFKIVTVARLSWIKGLDIAIEAMKLLHSKGIHFTYHIIGDGEKVFWERYKYMSFEMDLTNSIKFHEKLTHSETMNILKEADLYIQPSLNEGFCNAVLEAQAMGKLCIASNVGGLPENIIDGETGWLVPSNNPKALANKIIEIKGLTSLEKNKVIENASLRVKRKFTIAQQQEKFVAFYSED